MLSVIAPVTGEVLAEHTLVGPGETSIVDAHYDRPRPDRPNRAPRPRTQVEKDFCALGPVAEAFLVGAAPPGSPSSASNSPTSSPSAPPTVTTRSSPPWSGP